MNLNDFPGIDQDTRLVALANLRAIAIALRGATVESSPWNECGGHQAVDPKHREYSSYGMGLGSSDSCGRASRLLQQLSNTSKAKPVL